MGTSFGGYSWKAEDLDDVMHRYAIGDAQALIQTAIALHRGDQTLSVDELTAAAKKLTSYVTNGHRYSPTVLADIMQARGVAEETALLRTAKRLDNGDKFLSRGELERAADVLQGLVGANDIAEVQRRVAGYGKAPGVTSELLGVVDGHNVTALHLPHTGPGAEPRLRVVVTGGVHGNEPCGTGAAMLLLEQLIADPKMREEVAFTVVPLVNPRGYAEGSRRTPEDIDLNRNFLPGAKGQEEVQMMEGLLGREDFQLAIDLHAGYASRDGFWLYHVNSRDLAKEAMGRFAVDFPALSPKNAGKPMVSPGVVESDPRAPGSPHGGTLKDLAIDQGARWSFTVEAPGSVGYVDQVMGENEIVHQLVLEARRTLHVEGQTVGDS